MVLCLGSLIEISSLGILLILDSLTLEAANLLICDVRSSRFLICSCSASKSRWNFKTKSLWLSSLRFPMA